MNEKSYSESYKAAGVDITAGYRAVELMKSHIARTKNEGCLDDIGGFGGLFGLNLKGYEEPVLVSGTDGVGTKLQLGLPVGQARHGGHRLRGHVRQRCDLLRGQAAVLPGLHRLRQKRAGADCRNWCPAWQRAASRPVAALIGGETAEMPGFYPVDEYDLAGFSRGHCGQEEDCGP